MYISTKYPWIVWLQNNQDTTAGDTFHILFWNPLIIESSIKDHKTRKAVEEAWLVSLLGHLYNGMEELQLISPKAHTK